MLYSFEGSAWGMGSHIESVKKIKYNCFNNIEVPFHAVENIKVDRIGAFLCCAG